MKKFSMGLLLFLFVSHIPVNASVFKLADVFFHSGELKSKVMAAGVSQTDATRLISMIDTSVGSITESGLGGNFLSQIKNLPTSVDDNVKKTRLIKILSQQANSVTGDDFIEAVNDLIYLADRYGLSRTQTLSCSVCITDELSQIGIKNSISQVTDANVARVLKTLPSDPRKITLLIKKRLSDLGAQDVTQFISETDERAFALFLELDKRGDKSYQDFVRAVISYNKNEKGEVYLAGPRAIAPLWRVLNAKLTNEKIVTFTKNLNEVLSQKPSKRNDAFFDVLRRSAGDDEEKLSSINELKANNCFFN